MRQLAVWVASPAVTKPSSKRELRQRLTRSEWIAGLLLVYPLAWAGERLLFGEGDRVFNAIVAGGAAIFALLLVALRVLPDRAALTAFGRLPDVSIRAIATVRYWTHGEPAIAVLLDILNRDDRAVSLECRLTATDTDGSIFTSNRGYAERLDPHGPPVYLPGTSGWLPLPISVGAGQGLRGAIAFPTEGAEGPVELWIYDRETGERRPCPLPPTSPA